MKGKFPNFKAAYGKWEANPDLDMDRVHSLAFIRLLGHVREELYKNEKELCDSVDGKRRLDDPLWRQKIDIRTMIFELRGLGLDVMKFKHINRLRNAFVKRSAHRWCISSSKGIVKELNDLCIEEEDDFVTELRRLTGKVDITPDDMLLELHQDDAAESGKCLGDLDVNVAQLLHVMHKAWFTVRGPPRDIGPEDIKNNAMMAARLCNGALLDIHKAIAEVCPDSRLADIAKLPDIGSVIEESLSALRKVGSCGILRNDCA